ncbi:hypothetical protein ACGFX4_29010 [Kitasatospora sp. NPDC048365]|uniref:PPE domain-containing protein n=1 Tax=Kitasatospora sp. NPDC048365 TaxID=3364050 RepID=UPI00371AA19D
MTGTNFHDYSHGQMRGMLDSMQSGAIMSASDPWRNASATLKDIHGALNTASADAVSSWDGTTSTAFHGRMTYLAALVNDAAAYANDAANAMDLASQAIEDAKSQMPEEPSFWDKAGDALSDTAKGAVGVEDEDTRTTITDARKAEAAAVMQTLAVRFTAAKNSMKPPQITIDDPPKLTPHDPSGAEAIGAMIMGGGMGFVGGSRPTTGTSSTGRASGPSGRLAPQAPRVIGAGGPTDSGIKGGTANPAPRPKGPSTGIDGTHLGGTGTLPGSNTGNHPTGPGGLQGGSGGGQGHGGGGLGPATSGGGATGVKGGGANGPVGGSGARGGAGSNSGRGGPGSNAARAGTFGAGGMGEGGRGAGAGAKGGAGGRSGLVSKGGGVVGEASAGRAGGRTFTEGGSGIGRGRGGQAAGQGAGGQGHGAMGQGQAGKKDKKQGKDRPDYLVEDEETWASGDQVNPNVVE